MGLSRRSFLGVPLLWPGLRRARAAVASPTPHSYVALGDSFSAGTGVGAARAFPVRLCERLQQAGVRLALTNLAVNGFTTRDLIERELPAVPAAGPRLVTLAIGANDIVRGAALATYRAELQRVFAALRAVPLVVTLPQPDWSAAPAAALFADPGQIAASIQAYNRVLRDETRAAERLYVDLWPLLRRQARAGAWADDHLHPSAAALDEWAAELARALRGRLP